MYDSVSFYGAGADELHLPLEFEFPFSAWFPGDIQRAEETPPSRDGARTPMQWDDSPQAGVSFGKEVEPWLPAKIIRLSGEHYGQRIYCRG